MYKSKISETIVKNIEPIILGSTLGGKQTLIYVFGKKLLDFIYLFNNVIIGSSFSSMVIVENQKNKNSNKLLLDKLIILLPIILISIYISVNNTFLLLWVGEKYIINSELMMFLSLMTLLLIYFNYNVVNNFSKNKLVLTTKVMLLESVSRILLVYIMFKYFGLIGGPVAICFTILIALLYLGDLKDIFKESLMPLFCLWAISLVINSIDFNTSIILTLISKLFFSSLSICIFILTNKKIRKEILLIKNYIFND